MPDACVLDKVIQFQTELAAPGTDEHERLLALKFLLHFVGDIHQPLHSSDNHDRGGNEVKVTVDGFPHHAKDELHGFWDTQFVDALGMPPATLAANLLQKITVNQARSWASDKPEAWQQRSFDIAKADTYGTPPLSAAKPEQLDASYVKQAENDVRLQLSRAGIRLANLLNTSLGTESFDWANCVGGTKAVHATAAHHAAKKRSHRHRARN